MNHGARMRMLIKNYVEAKLEGPKSGFDIIPVNDDSFEEFYICLKPTTGLYRDQYQILHMKTTYGANNEYQYPMNAPYIKFITNVYHTNISSSGSICLDILKDPSKWQPTYDFIQIIYNIILLYQEPNTNSPFNAQASREYSECRSLFKQLHCKDMSVEEVSKCEEKAFALHKEKCDRYAGDSSKQYAKWFPQIVGEDYNEEQKTNFKTLKDDLDAREARKQEADKAKKASASTKKIPAWKLKQQKNKKS